MNPSPNYTWATLICATEEFPGGIVVGHSLAKCSKQKWPTLVIALEGVAYVWKYVLCTIPGITVLSPTELLSRHPALADCLADYLRLSKEHATFAQAVGKIVCWTLTDYDKCAFLESDSMVIGSCDTLLENYETKFPVFSIDSPPGSAFVCKPDIGIFREVMGIAVNNPNDTFEQIMSKFCSGSPLYYLSKIPPIFASFDFLVSKKATIPQIRQRTAVIRFDGDSKPWNAVFSSGKEILDIYAALVKEALRKRPSKPESVLQSLRLEESSSGSSPASKQQDKPSLAKTP